MLFSNLYIYIYVDTDTIHLHSALGHIIRGQKNMTTTATTTT